MTVMRFDVNRIFFSGTFFYETWKSLVLQASKEGLEGQEISIMD